MPEIAKDDPEVAYVFVADKEGVGARALRQALNGKPITDAAGKEMLAPRPRHQGGDGGRRASEYVFAPAGPARTAQRQGTVVLAYSLKRRSTTTLKKIDSDKEARVPGGVGAHRARRRCSSCSSAPRSRSSRALRISRPIKMLAWRADQIARGDLETRVEISSGDEIGMLGENFNYMADRLAHLDARDRREGDAREGARGRAHHSGDAGAAAPIRSSASYVKLAGYFLPASQCGGDWWTVHDLPDGTHPGRHRRRHRPRRAVGDDHRRGQGGVRRRARHRGRRAHGDARCSRS